MQNEKNNTADRELKISRLLDAPIELVWEVWTNPEHLKNWWGPNGFTNTIHQMEMVEGSEWLLTMHGSDGTDYPNKSIFTEIVLHKKIAFKHLNPNFITTVNFESQGNQTLMQWHMLFDTVVEFEAVVKTFKADEGLKQNIEKLSVYLSKQKSK
ncbi:MAG: hypothetical protein RJA07_1599 [Bacteroidota bacterium]|jgi:uncharacterized protein YndB with AHSA1/START domain